MALKLKMPEDNNQEENVAPKSEFDDLEETVFRMTNNDVQYSSPSVDNSPNKKLVQFITYAVIAIIFMIGFKIVFDMFFKPASDITPYVTMSEKDIASSLKLSFSDNPNEVNQIYEYSNGKVSVKGGKDLSIVYIDGKQVGVKFNTKKYSMFGVAIGDAEYTAVDKFTYTYDDYFSVINNIGGSSEEYFYYNEKNNDCVLMIVSNGTNRIVSMTYYTDYKKISKNLTFD